MPSDDDLLREFGDRLRTARRQAGLSQEALAHEAGLHRTYIGSVERGERNIALLNILTLATVLGTDAGTLLTDLRRPPHL
ncbi:helix-turn-helix domain-containing protein [Corynebacterium doosanense]|uniref:DNA-binding protein n=1 Tax=Corynebacterium doosanense CAU 212 = DSM 45436 TaxID=558173 RepID=A0A097ID35_9CORY|nr:helix-turn-helix transcriptional regulator [Corynebacterium doosanense]AIT60036.1 DNA-binding protein [Corynebacterium doosanense CAU 212 = DSM 45436]